MSFFKRIFGRKNSRIKYPPALAHEIEKAMNNLQTLTTTYQSIFQIGEADWSVDQDEGTIVFTSPTGIRAVAPVQIIGTYNTHDGTWLWGWDNPSVVEPLSCDARQVLAHGRKHDYDVLTTRELQCSEQECWELTALACLLCEAQCAYRGPAGTTMVFMTFGQVKMTKA